MSHDLTGLHLIVGGERAVELARIGDDLGASVIQLREKHQPTGELLRIADAIRLVVKNACFIVNDRTDIARAVAANGVHLGQDDLPIAQVRDILGWDAIIGVSCCTMDEALRAEAMGANYIGFGHLYPTASKRKETPPRSIDELARVSAAFRIPVVAIGGITPQNAPPLLQAGAAGIAVIGAVQHAKNPTSIIQEFLQCFQRMSASVTRAI